MSRYDATRCTVVLFVQIPWGSETPQSVGAGTS